MTARLAVAAGVLATALAGGAAVAAAPLTATRATCTAGAHPTKLRGHPAMRFCGSAKATVRLGRRTLRFAGGDCSRIRTFFAVSIGTTVTDTSYKGPRPDYFGITARRARAGRQPNPAIAFVTGGKSYALTRATVSLARGLRRGTFRGTVFPKRARVSGSFAC